MNNLGFKLWRWMGRKCGWYVEWPQCTTLNMSEFSNDPEMWTETKAVEKP